MTGNSSLGLVGQSWGLHNFCNYTNFRNFRPWLFGKHNT